MQRCCDDYVLYAVPDSIRFLPQRRRHSIVRVRASLEVIMFYVQR